MRSGRPGPRPPPRPGGSLRYFCSCPQAACPPPACHPCPHGTCYPCCHGNRPRADSTRTGTVAAHRKRWHSPVMKARGRGASVASLATPALVAAAVLALSVPMVRLASSYPDTAPGGGAPWQVALQAAAAAGAVAAGAALAAHRATALCGTLLTLAGPAIVVAATPVAQARPALLFTIVLAGAALAPALLGAAALTCPVRPLSRWDRLAAAAGLIVAGLVSGLLPATLFDPQASGCFTCAANLAEVHAVPDLRASLIRWGLALTIGTGPGMAVLAVWRWLRAPRIVRLVNAPVAVGGAAAETLRHSLAESIDDPALALVFPREDGTVIDATGQPAASDGAGLAVATVRRASRTVAEVRYRAEL